MTETNNRASGFDYLRLILSLAVILWHSYVLSEGRDAAHDLSQFFLVPVRSILICFFALSGFLVAGSLLRCKTLFMFLGLRVVRIVPALFLEVTISALLLGPLVTTVPLSTYFSSQEFHSYFLNIAGIIHYTLPGVFETNPFPKVINGQLWTIPWELECYVALSLLSLVGIVGRR
ncbi:Acyltransferase family protein [Duganella sacchari]|uniref:Acyltransferase family protein n=1 Tax=Duganella sacchari TaxID=551987 RepID=A0A1M7R058_9BURK|nr:acyltransferase [Duganella sacchari]SHN38015.1 Acyltransferase family protein [Duganella sacchari]